MEWEEVTIADIAILKNGKKRPTSQGTIPVYGGNGIMDYVDVYNDEYNLVVGRVGAYCGCVYLSKGKCWVSDNAISVKAKQGTDNKFLFYLLCNQNINHYHIGGAQPLMTQDIISRIEVSIPKSEEHQHQIAIILSALDSKIENNNKINGNLEAQAQALFKSWFVDFTPFKDQPFVDSELGSIPQGWKVGKINEFVDVIYGAPYKSKLFNTQKEGLPLIRIRDLKTCSPQFYTKELLPNTELVNYGDVVAGMDAEFTPHIWLGETGLLNQRVCKFKPHTGISPLYSMFMIKPKLEFAQNYKVGTTVSHLGKSDIDKFIVIVPPLDIVKEASSIFDAILNEQINLAKEN